MKCLLTPSKAIKISAQGSASDPTDKFQVKTRVINVDLEDWLQNQDPQPENAWNWQKKLQQFENSSVIQEY